ncbi:MAG: hypothetical protein P4L92_23200 [Rudaea sp.]|nr:hypothetical protein [Rudaea sp.]
MFYRESRVRPWQCLAFRTIEYSDFGIVHDRSDASLSTLLEFAMRQVAEYARAA